MQPSTALQSFYEFILSNYNDTRSRGAQVNVSNSIYRHFRQLEIYLEQSQPVRLRNPSLKINWSIGMGNWARIPWIGVFNQEETNTARKGIYIVYLFCQDMSGVYLTFNQGVTAYLSQAKRKEARMNMRASAESFRQKAYIKKLIGFDFKLDNNMDLHTDANLGHDYEHSVIAYKFYPTNAIPSDPILLHDLEALLQAYDSYLSERPFLAVPPSEDIEVEVPVVTQKNKPRIFISHSHQDIEYSCILANALREKELDVWYDEHNLGAGRLREVIENEMAGREHFILVLSLASVNSSWVRREYNAAMDLKDEGFLKTFLPVVAERCIIPLMVRGYKRVEGPEGEPISPEQAATVISRIIKPSS
jgi:hypothetical protein